MAYLPKIFDKFTEKKEGGQAGWAKFPTFTENLFLGLALSDLEKNFTSREKGEGDTIQEKLSKFLIYLNQRQTSFHAKRESATLSRKNGQNFPAGQQFVRICPGGQERRGR